MSDANNGRPMHELRDTGLLWLINTTALHPRGFALALHLDDEGLATGWSLFGDGSEPWVMPDDDYLDSRCFRTDSTLGVPGLVELVQKGGVTVCNAIGTGIADDKAVYPFVPDMIRFYLGEEPLLQNVPTYLCRRKKELEFVLANLESLVVKEAQGSGGYGMLIGPKASKAQLEDFRARLKAHPSRYIAQPTLALSTCPTLVNEGIAPRHVDLRPFVLSGKTVSMVAGGLTRVALKRGSLVVNSSQGGGTKDTWVLHRA